MESNRLLIGAGIFILLIVGSNIAMYIIARSWAKGDSRWMTSLRDSLNKPMDSPSNKSMDVLRTKIEELERNKKDDRRTDHSPE